MTVHIIHGFNVSDGGKGSVRKIAPYLGPDVICHDYGYTELIGLRCANREAVRKILETIEPGDFLVGHSNGGLICWKLAEILGDLLGGVVVINAALRRDTIWPEGLPVLCLYNSTDWVVQLGRFWSKLVSLGGLRFHGWGAAGRYGFTEEQATVDNRDTSDGEKWLRPVTGHSGIFSEARYWGRIVAMWISLYRSVYAATRQRRG